MTSVEGLSLYHYPSCGYCRMVLGTIEGLGIEIELRDIHGEPERMRELVEATGRQTVPCLRIEDAGQIEWMHESRAIIAYFGQRFGT